MAGCAIARVVRSGLVESVHRVHVAVADPTGRLIAYAGDPDLVIYGRSCLKPFQAAASLSVIGPESISDGEVAIICSSHNGEDVHIRAVRAVLRRAGLPASALGTPPARPLDPRAAAHTSQRRPIFHNCSGKHAGMLLACRRAGWDPGAYLRASQPLQRRIRRAVLRAGSLSETRLGVDGCGAPVFTAPLRSMATMFARLSNPAMLGSIGAGADRAVRAMLAEPYLVGGRNRADTDLMSAVPDVVAKEGAEALFCACVIPAGLGVAARVEDGGYRAAAPALLATLGELGFLDASQLGRLGRHTRPAVLGGGRPVGEVVVDLHLQPGNKAP
jgi:L-asparaginase II